MKPITIDFETYGIEPRPDYPPVPVGVAIKRPGRKAKYYAWDHQTGVNTCTRETALAALRAVWDHSGGLLFHNAKFDLDVAEVHFGLKPPPWDRVHDTVYLAFLHDPHARRVDLKSTAQRLLDWPPGERDAVADWLVENQPVPDVKISRSPQGKEPWGKYIAYAPPGVVGPYAIGDVDRTAALFDHLYLSIVARGMSAAYDRERRLLPVLLDMERRGVPVDLPRLRADAAAYNAALARAEAWVLRRLGRSKNPINLDSGAQLVAALVDAGKADASLMGVTKTGLVRSDKAAIAAGVTDRPLAATLRYTAQLKTCLRTFMEPWLATAERSRGLIYTNWNQTRGESGGARTGRLSSTPNLQNIPKTFKEIGRLPAALSLPPLPLCRGYVAAPKGHVLCDRDFASQELRVLAHFEDGAMKQSYLDDPRIDFHQLAAEMVTKITEIAVVRDRAKTIGFSIIYGEGRPKLAWQLACTVAEADRLLDAYFKVFPGIRDLQKGLKLRAAAGQPIRTAGGREYYCEPPALVDGKMRRYEYKLLNYLVQGSSADQTKDAMIRFHDAAPGRLLLSAHDELLLSTPARERDYTMKLLKIAMEDAGLDVPMLSDGKWGATWGTLERSTI